MKKYEGLILIAIAMIIAGLLCLPAHAQAPKPLTDSQKLFCEHVVDVAITFVEARDGGSSHKRMIELVDQSETLPSGKAMFKRMLVEIYDNPAATAATVAIGTMKDCERSTQAVDEDAAK